MGHPLPSRTSHLGKSTNRNSQIQAETLPFPNRISVPRIRSSPSRGKSGQTQRRYLHSDHHMRFDRVRCAGEYLPSGECKVGTGGECHHPLASPTQAKHGGDKSFPAPRVKSVPLETIGSGGCSTVECQRRGLLAQQFSSLLQYRRNHSLSRNWTCDPDLGLGYYVVSGCGLAFLR